jgi:hypothetical protein
MIDRDFSYQSLYATFMMYSISEMDMTVVSESLHRSDLLSEENVTLRVIQAGSADRKLPEVQEGQVQEEERVCYGTRQLQRPGT